MKKLFVSYEIAKQLKEKGFNEPCLTHFFDGEIVSELCKLDYPTYNKGSNMPTAPLYQQVIDWFREKHNIEVSIKSWKKEGGENIDYVFSNKKVGLPSTFKFDYKSENYYETLNKAIEEAFKLI